MPDNPNRPSDQPAPPPELTFEEDPEIRAVVTAAVEAVEQKEPTQDPLEALTQERDTYRTALSEAQDKLRDLAEVQAELEDKINTLQSVPHSYGTIAAYNQSDDSADVYLGGNRRRVRIMSTVTHDEIRPGLPALIHGGSSAILEVLPDFDRVGVVMQFAERIDARTILVTSGHDNRIAVTATPDLPSDLEEGTAILVSDGMAVSVIRPNNAAGVASQFMLAEMPDVTIDDIGGLDTELEEIIAAMDDPLTYEDGYDALDMKKISHTLLIGLPGNGKTLIARLIARLSFEAHKDRILPYARGNFVVTNGTEFYSKYLGDTEKLIRETGRGLERLHLLTGAPMFWFFDDCEAFFLTRDQEMANTNINGSVVGQFSALVDGVRPLKGVNIIAATNRLDKMDPAVVRRFDNEIRIKAPDTPERATSVLTKILRKTAVAGDRQNIIKRFIASIFTSDPSNSLLEVIFESRDSQVIKLHELLSGKMLADIAHYARTCAKNRGKHMPSNKRVWAVTYGDLLLALDRKLKEKESLPSTKETVREWLRQRGDKRTVIDVVNLRERRKLDERDAKEISKRVD